MRKKTDDPLNFTEEEVAVSRSDLIPAEIREFMHNNHGEAGERARYYRKVTALAASETAALLAIRELGFVREEIKREADLREELAAAKQRSQALEAQLSVKDETIIQLTAAPAMVVHSGHG